MENHLRCSWTPASSLNHCTGANTSTACALNRAVLTKATHLLINIKCLWVQHTHLIEMYWYCKGYNIHVNACTCNDYACPYIMTIKTSKCCCMMLLLLGWHDMAMSLRQYWAAAKLCPQKNVEAGGSSPCQHLAKARGTSASRTPQTGQGNGNHRVLQNTKSCTTAKRLMEIPDLYWLIEKFDHYSRWGRCEAAINLARK